MANSTIWIIAIAIGAVIVAVANIQYNRSREAENRNSMASQALLLLKPELQRNQDYLPERLTDVYTHIDPTPPFEITAWNTVSGSQLVTGIKSEVLTKLLEVYYQMTNANSLHSRYMDIVTGFENSLPSAQKTKPLLQGNLEKHYQRIQKQLEVVLQIIEKNISES